jgi:citrate lyase beta subunit
MGLSERDLDELAAQAEHLDRLLLPGQADVRIERQPIHTVYLPADKFGAGSTGEWATAARVLVRDHGRPPFPDQIVEMILAKLVTEPIEDLRVDFEDGYGRRGDDEETAHATAAGAALRTDAPPFFGLRCKSLEPDTVLRAARTIDAFLTALGPPPPGFVITFPKATSAGHADAAVLLCRQLEHAHGLTEGTLRFELQVETPQAILGADGRSPLPEMIVHSHGRLTGLHYGTYDYSTALGIAPAYQSLEHPVADHAKAVMQVAAAGTGVNVADGSTNVIPGGTTEEVHRAWALHARLVRRGLERGIYQGWDLHPGHLVTRWGATFEFFRDGAEEARRRLGHYLGRRVRGHLDEPATARAMARFLLRGLHCGALQPGDVRHPLEVLEAL